MRVGVTGASGFIGRATVRRLSDQGCSVIPMVRNGEDGAGVFATGDIACGPIPSLPAMDCLVHLAGASHVPKTANEDAEHYLAAANVRGTKNILEAAISAGVKRFIFVSTAKVHGESTEEGLPFVESSPLCPKDGYSRSKAEAEALVAQICAEAGISFVILRPPLVFGKAAGENFTRLVGLATSGFPLPLANIQNKRSMIFVDNLADCISQAVTKSAVSNSTYLVSDDQDFSTTDLIKRLSVSHGAKLRLVSAKPIFWALSAFNVEGLKSRLFGSLQLDSRKFRRDFQWTPPVSADEAFRLSL